MLNSKQIILVEDNLDDIELTLRTFKSNNITNEVIVKRDREKTLDFFFRNYGLAGFVKLKEAKI